MRSSRIKRIREKVVCKRMQGPTLQRSTGKTVNRGSRKEDWGKRSIQQDTVSSQRQKDPEDWRKINLQDDNVTHATDEHREHRDKCYPVFYY